MAASKIDSSVPRNDDGLKPGAMPIIAIGASAGGLEAASTLLDGLPATTGAAWIVVQHLDPDHDSLLTELLASHTAMNVVEATDGCQLVPDQILVIPPGRYLSVRGDAVNLSKPQARHGARLPFDVLLASLAVVHGPQTVSIILSGTGADGSGGLAALKAAGGYAIAQQPEEAEFDGMPRNAIATGLVDQVLLLKDMPKALAGRMVAMASAPSAHAVPTPPAGLEAIIATLHETTRHDFRQYKTGTLERRIARRMALLGLGRDDLAGYLAVLRDGAAERDLLAKDLLIHVTSFFRDSAVFDMLADRIVPEILAALPEGQPLRIWVAGCSTGEEAYSLAIICLDAIAASKRNIRLQMFASDTDPDAIARARDGFYPLEARHDISAAQLARHFATEDAGYRVNTTLRGCVVFTVQDVLTDPPFSKIDLVSCRNLLIYLNPDAQAKVIALFHFALREGGVLLLGSAETVGKAHGQFEALARDERIYRNINRERTGDSGFALPPGSGLTVIDGAGRGPAQARQSTLADICNRAVMASHPPAAVLIDDKRQCVYSTGPTGRYLRIAPGNATHDLLAMATPALANRLRRAIERAGETSQPVDGGRASLTRDGVTIRFRIDVRALAGETEQLMLVCFTDEPASPAQTAKGSSGGEAERIGELERELEATRIELQTAIQRQETATQDQKAINEEARSVNEEFQSTNEELLTSKEELQSLNEELTALNGQLQETLERQRLTSSDLQNVLYSTNVGTLFLDSALNIRFFTPAIASVYRILPGDVGRPLADLRPIMPDPELLDDARQVVTQETTIEREVRGTDESWFLRRIFPYRAHDNRVKGVVITFGDITERKLAAKALEGAKLAAERANLAKSRFLAAASHDLRQPLQSLTLLQELLTQSVEGEKPRKLLARLEQTLAAMSGMLNALLDINQIEAGVVEARPVSFPIADLFNRLRDEFTYMAQTRSLALHILPSAAVVHSDPRLLEQMIRNLLGNAIKYTRRGKIVIGCRRRGSALRIEVWDSGIGIAADELHAIFDEFHQVGNIARERSRGLGLGLSIVQRLGRLLTHEVDVRSLPGKGSVFTITIAGAVQPGQDHADALPVVPFNPVMLRHRCKIVVVDDDPDVLELLEMLLKGEGHIVKVAADADAAIRLVAGGAIRPEILLTDYGLPGDMNGLQLVMKLRASRPDGLPAIILTGDISRETLACIVCQDCVMLSKPVKAQELMAAVELLSPRSAPLALPAPASPPDTAWPSTATARPVTYVVDDDPEIRLTIRDVLEGDGRTVADFASAELFLEAYRTGGEGCLLVDAYLPGLNGVALLEQLRERGDHLPTILITGSSDVALAVDAMRKGACDFIEKPVGRAELLAAIARAIDQSHDIRLVDEVRDRAAAHVAGLTRRQREVMDMVLAGHPSKNIAADLGISQRTVENHRAAIMHKMGAKSLPELARTAQAAQPDQRPE